MRTITTETTVYKFEELSESAQETAIEKLYDINVDHDWWDCTYDDAERIGLKIEEFDTYRHEIGGRLTDSVPNVCKAIMAEHGESCDTYSTAKNALAEWDALGARMGVTENAEDDDAIYTIEDEREELEKEFEYALLQDYLSMLRKEYEYLTSREAIVECIEANEYEFTEDGKLY